MARKKVVLFIVEGITDKISLEIIMQDLINKNNEVIFDVVRGDITTDNKINNSNIKNRITEIIKDGGKRKFLPENYQEVIHLVDMDAAFISEDKIFHDNRLDRFFYTEKGIFANDIDKVIKRNKKKQQLLKLMSTTKTVFKSVPYRVFYFSSNLEHVLHNIIDVADQDKRDFAYNFEDDYIDDKVGFIDFMCKSSFSVNKNYKDSWDFICQNNNSMKRYTNIDILIKEYADDDFRD